MPEYDFRCDACAREFSLQFKTCAEYDRATPQCPECDSAALTRLTMPVALPKSNRDYRGLSSREMLSVLESAEQHRVDEMFRQVGGGPGEKNADPSADST